MIKTLPVAPGYMNELASRIFDNACEKGFYENGKGLNMGERLALIHGEVSEALEADRKNEYCHVVMKDVNKIEDDDSFITHFNSTVKGTFEEEMADIIIRVLDMCSLKNIDIDSHVIGKMRYNKSREKYHGKKY